MRMGRLHKILQNVLQNFPTFRKLPIGQTPLSPSPICDKRIAGIVNSAKSFYGKKMSILLNHWFLWFGGFEISILHNFCHGSLFLKVMKQSNFTSSHFLQLEIALKIEPRYSQEALELLWGKTELFIFLKEDRKLKSQNWFRVNRNKCLNVLIDPGTVVI